MLKPRYGIWIPVGGNHGAMDHPDSPRDANYARAKKLVHTSETRQGIDPNVVMFKNMAKYPAVGGNGGTSAGLVGSYDRVAERILEFSKAGIETFMLQFQPYPQEMQRFYQEVMPRVHAGLGEHYRASIT